MTRSILPVLVPGLEATPDVADCGDLGADTFGHHEPTRARA